MKLTRQQKLDAFAYRFYQQAQWVPKPGDFYTTTRADLELYVVVRVEDGIVSTRYVEGGTEDSHWPEAGFLTDGFGPMRLWVPPHIVTDRS